MFNTVTVNSTMIKSVGYITKQNKDTGVIDYKLRVWFQNDTIYDYDNVPIDIYNHLVTAPSKGKAFNYLIKDQFSFTQR